jgi:Polyketide cyclase / dehydrase and lipid transport
MKNIFIVAAMLAPGIGGAAAQTPQPADWVTLSFSADIAKPADVAWERVGGNDWCAIAKYLAVKGCTIDSGKGELGSLRTIITATGSAVENVVARTSRSYTYAAPFLPMFYHGTMAIEPVSATSSRLVYSLIWNQAGLPDQKARTDAYEGRKVRFQQAVDKMKAAAEAP